MGSLQPEWEAIIMSREISQTYKKQRIEKEKKIQFDQEGIE